MSARKDIVEKELGVSVPDQYALFLERYGIYEAHGEEVYGIHERLLNWDGIPCVIGATRLAREQDDLAQHFLLIHETGLEGELVLLDTRDGTIHLMAYGKIRKIADSFGEWFDGYILSFPEGRLD
jgi:hypothetical protein